MHDNALFDPSDPAEELPATQPAMLASTVHLLEALRLQVQQVSAVPGQVTAGLASGPWVLALRHTGIPCRGHTLPQPRCLLCRES